MKILSLIFFTLVSLSAFSSSTVLFIGDSLTEGYGVEKEKAYPFLVERELKKKGKAVRVLNGGVSGSTTASGASRLRWFLKSKPEILVLALGANDGLRGIKLTDSKQNLKKIIILAKSKGIKVILAGMLLPTNYGPKYRKEFENMFKDLSKELSVIQIPFILDGVGGVASLNQSDGIHPNEKGHKIIAKTVLKYLEPIL